GVIILVVTNFRMIMENLLKYGLLLGLPSLDSRYDWSSFRPNDWPCTLGILQMQVHVCIALGLEQLALVETFGDTTTAVLHGINLTAQLGGATWLVWAHPAVTSAAG
ncbi:unnamed protein product, partial [Heterosigma akashiwo]